ncbi:IstB domain protein ATP-binding protein [Denitrovibrio acetiphilus DSM 12809]|jgi:DNA replication protein DnaC|uniref:IstB domain protein ATP-binding protein n=1 Tax=Denitrovibrio acetiphilus (strain DSM 12809 / NBRC 114555 / N2460) TaxID=522772 RepID=D4H5C9_DENA2|nr:IS21-like element helper ATPase IstB [Denitrovibrio acetiphilus]ADD67549.1 IstB domain protein ATP-binding protein [Denitrovibrio acetiphilus DSM 12809]ADD67858.1 IstB domain protein ATP-binding protein [Denitrovibrio acetiphilus DSM 12809]
MELTEMMTQLRLKGFIQAYELQRKMLEVDELSFDERLRILLEHESLYREDRQLSLLLKKAKLRYTGACIEDIRYRNGRNITKQMMLELGKNDWVRKHRNIIITGASGVGKTYIACALGNSACRNGIKSLYVRLPRLLQELKVARTDGSYVKVLTQLSKVNVLIVDDWGLDTLNDHERKDFLEVMEDRYSARSTIIATQIPVDKWHDIIGDHTIADAICDRLVHNAEHLQLTGESLRKEKEQSSVNMKNE